MAPASGLHTLAYFDLRQTSPLGFPPRDILDAYLNLNNADVGTSFIQGEDGDGNLLFFIAPILSPLMGYRHIKGVGGAPGKIETAWVGALDVVMSGANSMGVEEVLFTSAFADPSTSPASSSPTQPPPNLPPRPTPDADTPPHS